jgi:hypothetical protein
VPLLFRPQRYHWVDTRRAQRWNQRGENASYGKHDRRHNEGATGSAAAISYSCAWTSRPAVSAHSTPQHNPCSNNRDAVADDQPDDALASGSECDTHADFRHADAHAIGQQAINTDASQHDDKQRRA